MLQKKLIGAMLAVLGVAGTSVAGAAGISHIEAGRLGRLSAAPLASRLGLGANTSLIRREALATHRGTVKTREQQTFRGVPVYGSHLVVERDRAGNVLAVKGQAQRDPGKQLASVAPRLTAVQAQAALKRHMGQLATPGVRNGEATLFVYPKAGGAVTLAYRTSYLVPVKGHMSRPTAIVDANTGAVIRQWEGLTTGRLPPGGSTAPVDVLATGPGGNELTGAYFYDGSGPGLEKLDAQKSGSTCYLKNGDVATYNLAGGQRVVQWSFGCVGSDPSRYVSSGDAINGAYSAINDAHHFGGVVQNMYRDWFAEPALTTDGSTPMQLSMWVHYGTNYENAFWDGREMVFGDGDQYFYPFVVLDITGHEISHGFTEQHAGLEYTAQSGGMNEAFSDMAGEAVKFYDRGSNDFMTGADIVKPATVPLLGLAALRDMCTPSNDGYSIDTASQYYSGIDVHYSSGVYNRAFCTLARTAGWDTRKAFEVFHDANALYWGPNETFNSGACGVESAASDRSYPVADVTAAFTAVGVSCTTAR
ncbi:M4 family metallopeptidase [Dyella sp.]|jgi:pseudolysin/vibriolysin|uniref:M4 family metallopeptidase n=1 Tax=Dyella sp. TaxID=1869338 RepID=UPI002D765048|nr:M4 family metallopeptidase [Dyella sp.]HET6431338.1 M4 family metallopeptidase [Dyella sp.]